MIDMIDERYQEHTIDLYKPHLITLKYKQYDTSKLIVTVLENGIPATFDRVKAVYKLTAGTNLEQTEDITYLGNVVTVNINELVVANAGNIETNLVFYRNGKRISTYIFYMTIAPSVGDDTVDPPDDEFVKYFNVGDWVLQSDGTYTIEITIDVHNLDITAYIGVAERYTTEYEPVTCYYTRDMSGTLIVMTDIPYTGRIVLRR